MLSGKNFYNYDEIEQAIALTYLNTNEPQL